MKRKNILKEAGVFLVVVLLLLTATMVTALTKNIIPMNAGEDTTPPVTSCTLNGTMSGSVYITSVIVTLSATDNESGVNYTKYNLDNGTWMTYTAPFIVSTVTPHVVYYYSVDIAGNIETTKNTPFIIKYPIDVSLKGGFGITATVKNNVSTTITNINWGIEMGKGLGVLFRGASNNGTIASLAPGASITIKCDKPIGFGFFPNISAWWRADEHAYKVGTVVGFLIGWFVWSR